MKIDKEPYERTSYMTVAEICARFHVHRNTVYNMIHDGRLPAFKSKVGQHIWLVKHEDVWALEDA